MSDHLFFEPAEPECDVINIGVIGVGGCGGNTVNLLADSTLPARVNIVAMNTDAKALQQSRVNILQLGKVLTRGLGAGAQAAVGRQDAGHHHQEDGDAVDPEEPGHVDVADPGVLLGHLEAG